MIDLSPEQVQNLVVKSFVLEAVADKIDCTSRSVDLPGKPLEDFIIAGINTGPFFYKFAEERLVGSKNIYSYFAPALKASNQHKSPKYINFGLLEIMFPVCAARLQSPKPSKVIKEVNKVLSEGTKSDFASMIDARKVAWSTSSKTQKLGVELGLVSNMDVKNPAEFYEAQHKLGEIGTSSKQWADQYIAGWPLLEEMFEGLRASKNKLLLEGISEIFNPIRQKNKDIRIGILADMCAAAIFLHLSYLK